MIPLLACASALAVDWTALEPGLELAAIELPVKSDVGDSVLNVVRVDPTLYDVRIQMLSALPATARTSRSVPDQVAAAGAVVGINAGMYETDYLTSTGAMWGYGHVNNPASNGYKSVFAVDPIAGGAPFARIADLTCGDTVAGVQSAYRAGVQSLRMIGCHRENAWGVSSKRWSAAMIGVDGAGRVLMMHVRSPYTMRDLIAMLLVLPLDLVGLQYAEGGPESTLTVAAGDVRTTWVGSYETGFWENDDNRAVWAVPNAIVAVPRATDPLTRPTLTR